MNNAIQLYNSYTKLPSNFSFILPPLLFLQDAPITLQSLEQISPDLQSSSFQDLASSADSMI